MAAVLSCGPGAVLSHQSAAALWGLIGARRGPIEISAGTARFRPGGNGAQAIRIHKTTSSASDRAIVDSIPVTSVARTLLDLAEVLDGSRLRKAFEEADRLGLLSLRELAELCDRSRGRRALRPIRRLIDEAKAPDAAVSPLEDRVVALCRERGLPSPATNVVVEGREVDAFWPRQRLMVEADSYEFHRHRAAFERDRARDAAMQVAGYRVVRLTHRRLTREPEVVASELRLLLARGERGQGAVEWVGLLLVVALLLAGVFAAGVRMPGAELARAVASRLLCAASMADRCGDEPVLIAAYGSEVGRLAQEHMPSIGYERGSRAVPVDFRRCRDPRCGDWRPDGLVARSDAGLPVTAFVHVVDCRPPAAEASEAVGVDCSGARAGSLYIQYWLYYADSATLRGVPVVSGRGFHEDDWESLQIRIGPDGKVAQRASSHHGYNHVRGLANSGSDAGVAPLRDVAEAIGARPRNGWGPESPLLFVSGGSHAGNVGGFQEVERLTPGSRVHLVPLEPIAAADRYRFAVTPPWRKRVWRDPEAEGTD